MKKSNFDISQVIKATAHEAWNIIGAVDGVDLWLEPITAGRVENDKRTCSTAEESFEEGIKTGFGSSPARYIREQRLGHAGKLLTTTQQSVSEVAFAGAFNDPAAFLPASNNIMAVRLRTIDC
ncbi:MAG: AraC family transcriptional regulator [Reichenbachiella sp.]|uniref:helix-turn-helix domain-containing protein n=1 Tax=Reichenbachiella sp. TaxID=2184521 RepID=UPI003267D3A3